MAALCAVMVACIPEFAADNPYDPEVPLELQLKASIDGLIRTAGGLPLEFAEGRLDGPTSPEVNPFLTGPDGVFRFSALLPGTYVLSCSHPAHAANMQVLVLAPGDSPHVDITLRPLAAADEDVTGLVTGVVHLAGQLALPEASRDHSGVEIEIVDTGIRVTSGFDGTFEVRLNAGTYSVLFRAPDTIQRQTDGVEVATGASTDLGTIVLAANPAIIRAVATGAVVLGTQCTDGDLTP